MRDPDLIDNQGQALVDNPVPDQWRSGYRQRNRPSYEAKFATRTIEELCKDNLAAFDKLAETFDRIADLQREKNVLLARVLAAQRTLKWEKWKSAGLILIVSGEAVVIGWLVNVVSRTLLH